MQRISLTLIAGLLAAGISLVSAKPKNHTYSGEIMDSACAAMGSHDQMEKQQGLKDAKDCTLACIKLGSKFVLYDSLNKTTYQLDDQEKSESSRDKG